MSGELKAIWLKRMKRGPMDLVNKACLLENKGIEKNANLGGKRQVTIIVEEVWDEIMKELGANLDPSTRRANLMVTNIDLKDSRGKVIKIGKCSIQIYGETKPCERMDEALAGLKNVMYKDWRGGAYGVVLNDGEIQIGDHVELIER